MKVAQIQVTDGQIKPLPLAHEMEPMILDRAVRERVSKLLAQHQFVRTISQTVAPAGSATIGRLRPVMATPAPGSGLLDTLPQVTPTVPTAVPLQFNWDHPLLFPKAALNTQAKIEFLTKHGTPGKPLSEPQNMPYRKISSGLWLRPLPVSDRALANVGHVVSMAQIGLEPASLFIPHTTYLPQIDAAVDVCSAVVAVAEIYQHVSRPKKMSRFKEGLFYLKRLLYIAAGTTHIVPVPGGDSLKLVGVIVKALDKGCDEIYAMRVREVEAV